MPSEIFELNPIQGAERLAATYDFAWNAFAYTYNNYSRPAFAPRALCHGNLLSTQAKGPRLRSVLGGSGIDISIHCKHLQAALDYTRFVADAATQKGIYLHAGGQPSHRAAWNDPDADKLCGGF